MALYRQQDGPTHAQQADWRLRGSLDPALFSTPCSGLSRSSRWACFKLVLPQGLAHLLQCPAGWQRWLLDRFQQLIQKTIIRTPFDVVGVDKHRNEWYMVIANHQSWMTYWYCSGFLIKNPLPEVFLKKELIWVPFSRATWWRWTSFMQRYSRKLLKRSPI